MSSTLQVKFSPLKNGELNPDDLHDNNFKGRSKKILKISAVIAHVILCAIIIGFVWYLYIKQNALEGALRDITYIRALRNTGKASSSLSETSSTLGSTTANFEDINDVPITLNAVNRRLLPQESENDVFTGILHLEGIRRYITFKPSTDFMMIKNWKLSNDSNVNKSVFDLQNMSTTKIKISGLYYINVQMAFRKRGGLAMFQIMNSSNVLSQCISYFPSTYATQQTCFTSVSQYLNEDDDLFVQINGDDSFTVDFETGKSFFELVILSPSSI